MVAILSLLRSVFLFQHYSMFSYIIISLGVDFRFEQRTEDKRLKIEKKVPIETTSQVDNYILGLN